MAALKVGIANADTQQDDILCYLAKLLICYVPVIALQEVAVSWTRVVLSAWQLADSFETG